MPVLADFTYAKYEDGLLTISLVPPTAIGQWTIQFNVTKRFDGGFNGLSGIYTASVASGFNNVSGINILDSGKGTFQVTIPSVITSGIDHGNYAGQALRLDSGLRSTLSEGYLILQP